MPKTWGHDELATDLANKFRADTSLMVWENMPMGSSGSQRPDVYVLQKSYARFCPITYECKVSVSDFRSDVTAGKWQGYLAYSSAVVFAVPAGLISKDDVPKGCGLIVRHDEVWRTVKKPTIQRLEGLPHDSWMKLLIDGIERQAIQQVRQRRGASIYRTEEALRKRHGEEVATLVAMALRAKDQVQAAIAADEVRRREIMDGTDQWVKRQRENAQREMSYLDDAQRNLAAALGLPGDAGAIDLRSALYDAARRLEGDKEIQRLRSCLERVKDSLDRGLEALPVVQEIKAEPARPVPPPQW